MVHYRTIIFEQSKHRDVFYRLLCIFIFYICPTMILMLNGKHSILMRKLTFITYINYFQRWCEVKWRLKWHSLFPFLRLNRNCLKQLFFTFFTGVMIYHVNFISTVTVDAEIYWAFSDTCKNSRNSCRDGTSLYLNI